MSRYSSVNDGQLFSLNQILEKYSKNRSYLIDKVFEIKLEDESESAEFRFVHMKASQVKGRDKKITKVIQIIDISDKMLYNEVKAE